MMTKKTSQKTAIIKKFSIIPILAGLLMLLCFKTVAQEKVIEKKESVVLNNTSESSNTSKENEKEIHRVAEKLKKEFKETGKINQKTTDELEAKLAVLKEAKLAEMKTKPLAEDEIINSAFLSEQPQFESGFSDFFKFKTENYKMPEEAIKNKVNGRIFLHFVIEKDGSLSNITLRRDLGFGTGEEAIRVLSICPKWKPGMLNGKAVRTSYSLPMKIAAN